ncbi:MAG: hypothetical protein ACREQY_06370, partial [Candidatus Binatia bacterium]
MRIVAAKIVPYRLRALGPLGGARWREGFILRLEGRSGLAGLGEASPAPWVGGESQEEARASLCRATAAVASAPSFAEFHAFLPTLVPSARNALETALLDLEARERGVPLSEILLPPLGKRETLRRLVSPTGKVWVSRANSSRDDETRFSARAEPVLRPFAKLRAQHERQTPLALSPSKGELRASGATCRRQLTEREAAQENQLEVSALVFGERPEEVARAAAQRVAQGFRTLKLKVGSHPSDAERAAALREA